MKFLVMIYGLCTLGLIAEESNKAKPEHKPQGHMGKLMVIADQDKDGLLSEGEVDAFIEKLSEKMTDASKVEMMSKKIKEMAAKHRELVLQKFDLDGDGALSSSEGEDLKEKVTERHQHHREMMLERFDANGDGELDESEREKLHERMKKRGPGRHMSPERRKEMMQKFDTDKDGKLSREEHEGLRAYVEKNRPEGMKGKGPFSEGKRQEILKKFDADGDGKLNEAERSKAREAHGKKGKKPDAQRRAEMLEKFDADGDGELNEAERLELKKAHPKPKHGHKRPAESSTE